MKTEPLAFSLLANAFALALKNGCGEKDAATKAVRSMSGSSVVEVVGTETARCTFERRRYGRANFFCWAKHPELGTLGDPWPASVWPRASLLVVVAQAFQRKQEAANKAGEA